MRSSTYFCLLSVLYLYLKMPRTYTVSDYFFIGGVLWYIIAGYIRYFED